MSNVPGWAYAAIVVCILFAIIIAGLGLLLYRTRQQLRSGNRVDGSHNVETGTIQRGSLMIPRLTRQTSTRAALSSISRVFAKDRGADDGDMEARSPMMADIGHSWSSPPRSTRSSKETSTVGSNAGSSSGKSTASEEMEITPVPIAAVPLLHVRSGSMTSSDGGLGMGGVTLSPPPRRVRGPRPPRVPVANIVIPGSNAAEKMEQIHTERTEQIQTEQIFGANQTEKHRQGTPEDSTNEKITTPPDLPPKLAMSCVRPPPPPIKSVKYGKPIPTSATTPSTATPSTATVVFPTPNPVPVPATAAALFPTPNPAPAPSTAAPANSAAPITPATTTAPTIPATTSVPVTPSSTTTSRPPSRSAVTPAMATFSDSVTRRRPSVSINTAPGPRKQSSLDWQPMPLIQEASQLPTPATDGSHSQEPENQNKNEVFNTAADPADVASPDSMSTYPYSQRTSVASVGMLSAFGGLRSPDVPPMPEIPVHLSRSRGQTEQTDRNSFGVGLDRREEREREADVEAERGAMPKTVHTAERPRMETDPNARPNTLYTPGHSRTDTAHTLGPHDVSPRTGNERHTFGPLDTVMPAISVAISPEGYCIRRESHHIGHRRGISDESYSSPAVEVTREVDENDRERDDGHAPGSVTPRTTHPITVHPPIMSINQLLAAADERDQMAGPTPPERLTPTPTPGNGQGHGQGHGHGHERSASASSLQSAASFGSCTPPASMRGHRRNESDWSTNSLHTRSTSATSHRDLTASCASLNSTGSSCPETITLNTPRSSRSGHASPGNNPYLNPSVSVYHLPPPPSYSGSHPPSPGAVLRLADLTSDQDVDDYMATVLAAHSRPQPKGLPRGALPAFLPGFPLHPSGNADQNLSDAKSPDSPAGLASAIPTDEGSWSSWGTNPDMERALFARLLALTNSSMGPLNMNALASISSIQSAMPSTPGGPDVCCTPTDMCPPPLLRHSTSSRSLRAGTGKNDPDRYASFSSAGSPSGTIGSTGATGATGASGAGNAGNSTLNQPRSLIANASANANVAALLPRLRTDSEELSTPTTVQPPDWDVTMWTSANVDGTL